MKRVHIKIKVIETIVVDRFNGFLFAMRREPMKVNWF